MPHGVPQGSILGPLLFNLHVNDLPLMLEVSGDMYADDLTIYTNGQTVKDLECTLNRQLSAIDK